MMPISEESLRQLTGTRLEIGTGKEFPLCYSIHTETNEIIITAVANLHRDPKRFLDRIK